ncbi:dihydrofolate reductase family protein [Allonocardiopsis opalescens]|uniref:Dihydrofolate reductase n=1 Tax=Allonocardiopsis opalescens TaxID=1144618 RepID=A0A2T0Q5H8_9ACTN|nr:dihydrofolate reductase family protein [Allonocardiopsis opalescens]PRX98971.1 dihydrofolate reductase [Allonocardiopsis opalescens]
MKLTTTTFVSIDGVMQGLGGPDEDRAGGFERGGWALPLFRADDAAAARLNRIYGRADAFLFGRRTYEIFAASWGAMPNPAGNPIAGPLNSRPKYVVSTTLTEPRWARTTVLSGGLAAAVGGLKAERDGELQVHGSGALIRGLLQEGLVDEINLFVCPLIIGQGTRLFPESGPDAALDLVETRTTPKGITIQTYRPAGRPEYEAATSS